MPTYVPPSKSPEPGQAPGLKVQLLTPKDKEPREYVLVFGKGDEVTSGLAEFAQKYDVTSARLTGVGAFKDVTVGWMDREKKSYKAIPIHSQVEVLSLIGDIATFEGKPAVHAHLVVGLEDGSAKGGHLLEAHVFPTLEVMVTVNPNTLRKKFDPETGLTLLDPQPEPPEPK